MQIGQHIGFLDWHTLRCKTQMVLSYSPASRSCPACTTSWFCFLVVTCFVIGHCERPTAASKSRQHTTTNHAPSPGLDRHTHANVDRRSETLSSSNCAQALVPVATCARLMHQLRFSQRRVLRNAADTPFAKILPPGLNIRETTIRGPCCRRIVMSGRVQPSCGPRERRPRERFGTGTCSGTPRRPLTTSW